MRNITQHSLPRVGISSCLLGQNVRYDGGNKKNSYIIEQLSPLFDLVPYCPEVAIGMGIPRPPIQLVDCYGEIRALGVDNPERDMTNPLREYGKKVVREIADLSGYIFKRNSPSCGITDVKVLVADNKYEFRGQGVFTAEIIRQFPKLPVIDEQQLMDPILRQEFVDQIKEYYQANNR